MSDKDETDLTEMTEEHREDLAMGFFPADHEILLLLARDESRTVRQYLARRKNISPDILDILSRDSVESIRYFVACNENTAPDTLTRLAMRLNCWWTRAAAASNLATPVAVLASLLTDDSEVVRLAVKKNSAFRQEIADELGISSDLPVEWRDRLVDGEIARRYPDKN